jgi:hypothetical protein
MSYTKLKFTHENIHAILEVDRRARHHASRNTGTEGLPA